MSGRFVVKLAETEAEKEAAFRLRYDVFVDEMKGDGPCVDHAARIETDRFDPFAAHMIVTDGAGGPVIAVYRLMTQEMADRAGGYYSAQEFDLTPVLASGRRCLELGRSCLHPKFRGGTAFVALWTGLADYISEHKIELLFGVASFHGTDVDTLSGPLSMLHHRHLAPASLRAKALCDQSLDMNILPEDQIDRRAAMVAMPSLMKAYLRMGGVVGQGAWIDHDFNTTDVLMIMDTREMNARYAERYSAEVG